MADKIEGVDMDPSLVPPASFPYSSDPKARLSHIEAMRFTKDEGIVIERLATHMRISRGQFLRCMFRQSMPQMQAMLRELDGSL